MSKAKADQVPSAPPDVDRTFNELYAETRTAMVRLASLLVASRAEAEELTQDAYIDLFRQWDEVLNPVGFLRTLVVRRCTRSRRRQVTERHKLQVLGRRDDPFAVASGEPELDETVACVRRLTPERRAVVVLRFYEDMSHSQIAAALDCSVATVRTRLHRALVELRKEIS
jgi:RNA polymerase sigma factor (sigma-70 family)